MDCPPAAGNDATLVILAGGRGRRMGGTKDRLLVGGRPILLQLLDQVRFGGPTLLVASPEHPAPIGHDRFDQIAFDAAVGLGPLAGVAAALAAASTSLLCVLSVDMPNVGEAQVRWLRDRMGERPTLAGLLCRRPGQEPRDAGGAMAADAGATSVEPFPCVMRTHAAAAAVPAHLARGGRSMKSLLDLPDFIAVDAAADWPRSVWANLNSPDDLLSSGVNMG